MAKRTRYILLALGMLCASAGLSPGIGYAAPGWAVQTSLATEPEHENASTSVAMDAKGDVLVVWNAPVANYEVIKTSFRPAGGSFQSPVTVSPVGFKAFDPKVVMDPRGDATVVWQAPFGGEGDIIEAASKAAGEEFRSAVKLSPSEESSDLSVAIDSDGDTVVAWDHYNDLFNEIVAATQPAGGQFSETFPISNISSGSPEEDIDATEPTAVMDARGDTTVAWSARHIGSENMPLLPYFSQLSTRPAGGNFTAPFSVLREFASVVAGPGVETLMTWHNYNGSKYDLGAAVRPGIGDEFGAPLGVFSTSLPEVAATTPSVATLDAGGEALVALRASTAITVVARSIGGPFEKPVVVGEAFPPTLPPALATDEAGDSLLMWANDESGLTVVPVVEASLRPANAKFGAPIRLAAEGKPGPVHDAIDSHGNAVGAWMSSDGTHDVLRVVGYQASGPQLEALQVPPEGRADEGLSFSVSPQDVWSGVAETTWSWGDGSPDSSGTSVSHAFAAAGTYRVSLTSVDTQGNSSTYSRLVTIQAGPGGITPLVPTGREGGVELFVPQKHELLLPVVVEPIAPVFRPLFATQASRGKDPLGRVVAIAKLRGVTNGDTVVVQCLVGCRRPFRETRHVSSHHNTHGAFVISPPLVVTSKTRLRIELLQPAHVTRFVDYRFLRTARGVIPRSSREGCLSSSDDLRPCPT